jgi:putative ABC transport system permease protein
MVAVMKHSFLRLGWRTLWRDLRAGELRLLIVAVTLAVAALTAVGFLPTACKAGCSATRASCWAATWWWSATTRPRRPLPSAPAPGPAGGRHAAFPPWGGRPTRRAAPAVWWRSRRWSRLPAARPVAGAAAADGAGEPTREVPAPGEGGWMRRARGAGPEAGRPLLLGDAACASRASSRWSPTAAPAS